MNYYCNSKDIQTMKFEIEGNNPNQIFSPLMADGGEDDEVIAAEEANMQPKKKNRMAKYDQAVADFGRVTKEGYDSPFNNDRGCVDVGPLIFFLVFLVAFISVTVYSFKNGDLSKLTAPLDASNNFCGEGDFLDYPKLFVSNTNTLSITKLFKSGVCVKKCPKKDELTNCKVNSIVTSCPKATYSTHSMIDYCIPSGKLDQKTEDLFKMAKT